MKTSELLRKCTKFIKSNSRNHLCDAMSELILKSSELNNKESWTSYDKARNRIRDYLCGSYSLERLLTKQGIDREELTPKKMSAHRRALALRLADEFEVNGD